MTTPHINVNDACVNPSKFFKTPHDVLIEPELSRQDKIEILRQWEIDARLLAVADEENMSEGESSHLGAVVSALIALDDEQKRPEKPETEKPSPPTKLGGGSGRKPS
jgi:hypothetical protein